MYGHDYTFRRYLYYLSGSFVSKNELTAILSKERGNFLDML